MEMFTPQEIQDWNSWASKQTKPESRVILFGDANDPQVQASAERIRITGRPVEFTGKEFDGKAFEGDQEPTWP